MKIAELTITAGNSVHIQAYLQTIAQQMSEGYTSGISVDGEVHWDLSEEEA